MLFCTFIRILTSLIRDFYTSDRKFASTFFQIPPHDGHPWSWLVVGHCDYNPHNRLSLSRYMPCPAYKKQRIIKILCKWLFQSIFNMLVMNTIFLNVRKYCFCIQRLVKFRKINFGIRLSINFS